MPNAEPRRKVDRKPRKRPAPAKSTSHGPERSYKAFSALSEEERARAAEMDCVIGRSSDSQCVLTLCARLQGSDLPASAREVVERRSHGARHAGEGDPKRTLPAFVRARPDRQRVRTLGHGSARDIGLPRDRPMQSVLLRPRQSQQKGDMAVVMSQLNSEPRPSLMTCRRSRCSRRRTPRPWTPSQARSASRRFPMSD